jgi:hypothetical protein
MIEALIRPMLLYSFVPMTLIHAAQGSSEHGALKS